MTARSCESNTERRSLWVGREHLAARCKTAHARVDQRRAVTEDRPETAATHDFNAASAAFASAAFASAASASAAAARRGPHKERLVEGGVVEGRPSAGRMAPDGDAIQVEPATERAAAVVVEGRERVEDGSDARTCRGRSRAGRQKVDWSAQREGIWCGQATSSFAALRDGPRLYASTSLSAPRSNGIDSRQVDGPNGTTHVERATAHPACASRAASHM